MTDVEKRQLVALCAARIDDGLAPLVAAEILGVRGVELICLAIAANATEGSLLSLRFPRTESAIGMLIESDGRGK